MNSFKMTPEILKSLMLPPNPAVNCKTIMEDQARATAEAQARWKKTLAERAAEEAKRDPNLICWGTGFRAVPVRR
jgi:hypothetical protein